MSSAIQDPEYELLRQVAQGDQAAFSRLFALYSDWVYATSLRLTNSSELAEEIVQDVFLKIWLKRAGLTDVERFSDYLFIIARNLSFTILRQMIRREGTRGLPGSAEPVDNSTDADILYRDYQSILETAISRLPHRQNQVYKLIRQEGLRREDAAERLGISPHTVKIHLKEALLSVRAYCMAHIDLAGIVLLLVWI